MKQFRILFPGILATTLFLAPAMAQQQGGQPSDQNQQQGRMQSQPIQGNQSAKQFIGAKVMDQNGNTLGIIDDMTFDQSGRIQQVVINRGGFSSVGQENYTIPWDSLRQSTQLNTYITTVPGSQLQMSRANPQQTGGNWIGKQVIGQTSEAIGSVQDVFVQSGQWMYVLIKGADEQLHPVPVSIVSIDAQADRLKLDIGKSQFDQSPSFSMNELITQGSYAWQARTDDYYQKFEVQRPVSQRLPGNQQSGKQGGSR